MAPPPPANLPKAERLKQLAKTLQFAWFSGHVIILLASLRYFLSLFFFSSHSGMARFSYRLAFFAAAVNYAIVVYRMHFSVGPPVGNLTALAIKLAADENVQYLGMAFVWLITRKISIALLPFTIYSVFHVATYARSPLIPTLQPPKSATDPTPQPSPLADKLGIFIKKYHDTSMRVVARIEMLLLIRLVFSALAFRSGSWVMLVIYGMFFRTRHSRSAFVQIAVANGAARIDTLISHQNVPPAVRHVWGVIKDSIRKVYYASDVSQYMGSTSAPQQRKTQ